SSYFKNYILVVCVLVAGVLELLFPLFALKREGFHFGFKIKEALLDPVLKRMLKLFVPRIWASVVYQLNVFVDTIYASFSQITGAGALAAINYSTRLIQLPFALIVLSITPVVVVDFSKYYKEGNMEDFKKLLVFSFQNIIFFVVPITIMFLFLPKAIVDVLFKRGEFNVSSLEITSSAFFYYSFGVLFMCANRLMVTSFYALKDTRTPAKTATVGLIINIMLNTILMFPLKIGGVALATSISSAITFILLYRYLIKRIGKIQWADTKEQTIKVFLISILAGAIASLLWSNMPYNKYIKALTILSVSTTMFISLGLAFGLKQLHYVKRWILGRGQKTQGD
ncbi:MAG: lipid II flippase MurJ, partial [Candidatus Omnitrophota bacterium]